MLVPALALAAIAPLAAQTLNPIVTVLSSPTSTVPEECEQGLAPSPAPRIVPEEVRATVPKPTPPTAMMPPPTASLRGVLREIQDAAERGDRDGFHDALARAHGFVDGYPPGGEKKAANDVLKVHDDLQSIWDYLFQSPTGAFFDASTDNLMSIMRAYPDYQRGIADQTIVDATGTRFYPTRETRDFLVREAAARLKRMGITAAAAKPPPETTTPAVVEPVPKKVPVVEHPPIRREPASAVAGRSTKPKPHPTKVAHKATKPPAKVAAKAPKKSVAPPVKIAAKTAKPSVAPPVKIAAKTPKPSVTRPTSTATKPSVAPPTSAARAPEVRRTTETSAPPPPPPLFTTSTTAPPPAATTSTMPTSTMPTTTSARATSPLTASTQTAATETPVQTTSAQPQPSAEPQPPTARSESRRNLILPLILIVVGVGVLILLFRTSS